MKNIFGFGAILVLMIVSLALSVFAVGPELSSISGKSVDEGSVLSFTVTSTAGDSPSSDTPITFKLCDATSTPCLPAASPLTIGSTEVNLTNTSKTTALFKWTPDYTQTGSYFINLSASDSDSSDNETFTITVADVAPTLSAPALSLGASNQKRSNPLAEEESDKNVNVTGTLTITNAGGETITNLAFSSATGVGKYSSAFTNANSNGAELSATSVAVGASVTATVTLRVPENLDAVDNSQQPTSFNVATLSFTGKRADGTTAITPLSVNVNMQAENNLEFKDANILFQEKSEKIRDNKNIDGIQPGDEIKMQFEVESKFDDKEQVDIEHIELEVLSLGDDEDLDVSEEESVDNLGPEDIESVEIAFTVEEDAKKGKEDMRIILKGEDENGAKHGERWEMSLEIEREDHEISIKSKDLSPKTVSCQSSANLVVGLRNTGRNDEEDVYLRVYSPEIGNFQSNIAAGDVDEDDETTHDLAIPIPEELAPGNYRITMDTYYDVSKKSSTDAVILTKEACSTGKEEVPPEEKKDEQQPIVVVTPPADTDGADKITGGVVAPPAAEEEKATLVESNTFIALLILAYAVVIGGGALVAMKLLRK